VGLTCFALAHLKIFFQLSSSSAFATHTAWPITRAQLMRPQPLGAVMAKTRFGSINISQPTYQISSFKSASRVGMSAVWGW
jgi:hypothetical protein